MKYLGNCCKKIDQISQVPSLRLHFGGNNNHRTVIGGLCTLMAFICFLGVAYMQFLSIYNLEKPFITQQEEPFESYIGNEPITARLDETYKIMFWFSDKFKKTCYIMKL